MINLGENVPFSANNLCFKIEKNIQFPNYIFFCGCVLPSPHRIFFEGATK